MPNLMGLGVGKQADPPHVRPAHIGSGPGQPALHSYADLINWFALTPWTPRVEQAGPWA